jgi:hypothetical protein
MYVSRQNLLLRISNRKEFILGKMKAKKSYHAVELWTTAA